MSIRDMKWVIIGRPGCKWCNEVRYLLTEKGIPFTYLNYHEHPGLKDFIVASGLTTVPQVYLNGQRLGGFEQTKLYLEAVDANASAGR
jgi:glutaredoxin